MVRSKSEDHICCGPKQTGFEDADASSYESRNEYVWKVIDGYCEERVEESVEEEIERISEKEVTVRDQKREMVIDRYDCTITGFEKNKFKKYDHYFITDYTEGTKGPGTHFVYEFYFEDNWHVKIEELIPTG